MDNSSSSCPHPSHFVRNSRVPFDEDSRHELKGHRSFAAEDINPSFVSAGNGRRTRQSVSKSFCGMLNTGRGGSIYLGVTDDGYVSGIMMTDEQKEHFLEAVRDTLRRYSPRVPEHMYEIRFVPVVDPGLEYEQEDDLPSPRKSNNNRETKPHIFRTFKYCWCDFHATARFGMGMLDRFYVVIIDVRAWDAEHPGNKDLRTKGIPELHPVFAAEDGGCYKRLNASNVTMTMEDVANETEAILRASREKH